MALTPLQRDVVRCIAANRSETSYVAGGIALNRDWPRLSDDVDIFHDTDEEIGAAANRDIDALRDAGFRVSVEIEIYGVVEAIVSRDDQSTLVQWMSESRTRFFPLVRDEEWGARLHQADLAVNKIIAASTRTKARDYVDLVTVAHNMCPLGPIVLAAAGKPPHFSPQKTIDEIRRRGLSVGTENYETVKGLPADQDAGTIREELIAALARAEDYILEAPIEIVGILAVDPDCTPVETKTLVGKDIAFRRATTEPEPMPVIPSAAHAWRPGR